MSRLINTITAVKSDVIGICQVKNVAGVVVTRLPMHALRLLSEARYLFARLLGRLGAGRLTLAWCQARSADSRAMRVRRPSRPRSAMRLG